MPKVDKCDRCHTEMGSTRLWYEGQIYHTACSPFALSSAAVAGGEEVEPVAWMHPTARWAHVSQNAVAVHCLNDGPGPIALSPTTELDALRKEIDRLGKDRDGYIDAHINDVATALGWKERADRAEAEVSRLTALLDEAKTPTHRHKKRGTEYVLIGVGRMQAEHWLDWEFKDAAPGSVDMREVAIYRSVDDDALWVRPREEFEDGRFEEIARAFAEKAGA